MTCLACGRHIEQALRSVAGVEDAKVDYRAARGSVDASPDVPTTELIGAVERAGYRAELDELPDSSAKAAGAAYPAQLRGGLAYAADRFGSESLSAVSDAAARMFPFPPMPNDADPIGNSGGGSDFDLFVVGTGGAGVAAAIQGAELGATVGIVESGTLGGTCVNIGCIPSKNLIEAAAHYHSARQGFPGIEPCEPEFSWRDLIAGKRALVEDLRGAKYADVLASYPNITVLHGRARLAGDGRVKVGETIYRAPRFVIATGTSPSVPPIPGLAGANPLNSTTAMELEKLPKSMIVLGGSAVGLELGQTFARFGVKVTVIELMPRLLPNEDEAISEALQTFLVAEGIEIHTGMTATRVEVDGHEVVVTTSQGNLTREFRAERLLVAAGRRANTSDMGLEEEGVQLDERGFVRVDAAMRTSNPDVYAAGDVTGGPGYVYVAAAGGRVAAQNALKAHSPVGASNELRELDLSAVPNVTFTAPQVASVGLTEAKARAAGYKVESGTLGLEHVPRALVNHDTRGLIKVVSDAENGKVLGVHAVTPNAGEMMGEATLAIRFGLTVQDLTGTLHPYLTWIEGLKLAAQTTSMDVSRLSCCA